MSAINALFNALMLVLEAWNCRAPAWQVRILIFLGLRWGVEMAVDLSMPVLVVDDYSTMIRIIRIC